MTAENGYPMHKKKHLRNIAIFIALLFHACGLAGILLTPYKNWFIANTWVNLLIMTALIVFTHRIKNIKFFFFFIAIFIIGFTIEIVGANTGLLFGEYNYGDVLGIKLFNVPLIIGINWFIIIYCTGMVTQAYENYMLKKMAERGIFINSRMKLASFIADAALLTVLFDWVIEPVASRLGYWQWENNKIPAFNYITWVMASIPMLILFRKLHGNTRNIFAVHLFIIQLLFFLILRSFL
jgi:putative membrane protein